MRELQRRRQATNVFAGKHGFITPRDLFKWAERGAVGYQVRSSAGLLRNIPPPCRLVQTHTGPLGPIRTCGVLLTRPGPWVAQR